MLYVKNELLPSLELFSGIVKVCHSQERFVGTREIPGSILRFVGNCADVSFQFEGRS